ncbi:riboflavin kinase [Phenylobacterium sp.]|uniref:riboflavin kinase n=1 Tax=Phenylobacterium sp. TaxID=1871053 RepID=UPI003BABEEB6
MKILRDWRRLTPDDRGAAIAFGDFDGVHQGHVQLIAAAAAAARAFRTPLGVVSCASPRQDADVQPCLTTPDQTIRRLQALGVDLLYLLDMDAQAADLGNDDFIREVLVDGLGVRHVATEGGMGLGPGGVLGALRRCGAAFGFTVSESDAGAHQDVSTCSARVREALRRGRPDEAAAMLGRPFAIEGVVQHGRKLGRRLGFPTANVPLGDYVTPRFGVYATRTRFEDGRQLPGVAHIGVNPTTGEVAPVLEVWLFDFADDIYGQTIETDLVAFQRPQETFASVDAMVEQVHLDAAEARRRLGLTPCPPLAAPPAQSRIDRPA